MSGQDYQGRAEPAQRLEAGEQRVPLSRRSVLRRSAGLGAVGLAVAAGGGLGAAIASAGSGGGSAQPAGGPAVAASPAGSDAIVIYMANPSSGEMQIFSGTGQTRHTNHAMAATVMSMAPQ
jgi:hypothetical protein